MPYLCLARPRDCAVAGVVRPCKPSAHDTSPVQEQHSVIVYDIDMHIRSRVKPVSTLKHKVLKAVSRRRGLEALASSGATWREPRPNYCAPACRSLVMSSSS